MRVLVCGGRDFNDRLLMINTFVDLFDRDRTDFVLIHGDARGADKLSEDVLTGYFHNGPTVVERYPADWKTHGKAAGPIRNTRMLEDGRPDLVVAFPGGKGTADMVRQARYRNVRVIEVMEIGHGHTSSSDS